MQKNILERDVWCFCGLVFDRISFDEAISRIQSAVSGHSKLFMATSNINWIALAKKDPVIQEAINRSDINTVDGMPVLWLMNILGLNFKVRVSGASVIEHLSCNESDRKFSTFLFGGPEGAFDRAQKKMKSQNSKLDIVGAIYPGYGEVSELSQDEHIEKINQQEPNILIVALGAKKGISWISENYGKLKINVVGHFGAVINFISGQIKRSPVWMQKCGFEWIWRIGQEPKLFTRYFNDAITIMGIVATKIIPYKIMQIQHAKYFHSDKQKMSYSLEEDHQTIKLNLSGVLSSKTISSIKEIFGKIISRSKDVHINFLKVSWVDGSFLGTLMLLNSHQKKIGKELSLKNLSPALIKVFKLNMIYDYFNLGRRLHA